MAGDLTSTPPNFSVAGHGRADLHEQWVVQPNGGSARFWPKSGQAANADIADVQAT